MRFKNIEIRNFRNFEFLKLNLSAGLNIFLGDNGQGKTNLLESLYLLSNQDSFRYGDNQVFIKDGSSESLIKSNVSDSGLDHEIKLHLEKSKKTFYLNQKKITKNHHLKNAESVIFSPESLSSIKEGSDFRRRLVDEAMISVHPNIYQVISDFRKAHKTRNRVLSDYKDGLRPKNQTMDVLESLNPIFFKLSAQVIELRIQTLHKLLNDINIAMQNISNNASVDISVEYVASGENLFDSTIAKMRENLLKRAAELREAELSAGTSLVGPQKHEINFLYNQKDSRFFCSQGQQRAIILSFKMAQIVYHKKSHSEYPVLMLDDVLSELDRDKRESLIKFLHEIKTQIFITSTDLALPESFELEESLVVCVKSGQILN